MTIDEAIAVLSVFDANFHNRLDTKATPAIQLGIEALKRIKTTRKVVGQFIYSAPLPGETEENKG